MVNYKQFLKNSLKKSINEFLEEYVLDDCREEAAKELYILFKRTITIIYLIGICVGITAFSTILFFI